MDVNASSTLLGDLTPAKFMRRYWQKKPLLVRQAWPGVQPPMARGALFDLVGRDDVESRLLTSFAGDWRLRHGPFKRSALPPLKRGNWSLLVQGLDLHNGAAHEMLSRFHFVPQARLDDLMISYASDGGGVGPHLDSYDVFLLQVQGRRRWRVGRVLDPSLVEGLPMKMLRHFQPTDEWLLEPGDMLYLPPRWGHDGVAEGPCMTCSVGFRAAKASELAGELLVRLGEDLQAWRNKSIYRDPAQPASATPGRLPDGLLAFAAQALQRALSNPGALSRALGSVLSEPKPQLWFDAGDKKQGMKYASIRLDRRSRMLYDDRYVFINGEAFRAAGGDARLMARLADDRFLASAEVQRLSPGAAGLIDEWARAGWLHADETVKE